MSSMNSFNDVHPELKRKWTQLFRFITGNRSNVMTKKHRAATTEVFLKNDAIPRHKREEGAKMFTELWSVIHEGADNVNCEQFIAHKVKMMNYHAGTQALALIKWNTRMFHIVDLNDDDKIDLSEFMIFSKATGYDDKSTIEKAFRAIDTNNDGSITKDEFISAYIMYDLDASVKMEDIPIYGLPQDGGR